MENISEKDLLKIERKLKPKTSDQQMEEHLLKMGLTIDDAIKILNGTGLRDLVVLERKLEFYERLFNLYRNETLKVIAAYPQLLGMDVMSDEPTSVKMKLFYYLKTFNLSVDEVLKVIKNFPGVLNYDVSGTTKTSAPKKFEVYKRELQLTDDELKDMFVSYPRMLSLDTGDGEQSVKNKLNFYAKELNASFDELKFVVVRTPVILGFDIITNSKTSAKRKLRALKSITTEEQIKKNPFLLLLPANKVRFRYMLLYPYQNNIAEKGELMLNEKTAYARICHLERIGVKPTLSRIAYPGVLFKSRFGVLAEENYPITIAAINKVEERYNKLTGKHLKLDHDEIMAVAAKYNEEEGCR